MDLPFLLHMCSGPVWPVDMVDKEHGPEMFFNVPRDVFREYNGGGVEYSEASVPVTVTIEYRGKGFATQDTVL